MQELAPTTGEADVDQAAREFLDTLPGSDFVLPPERLESQRLIHTKVIRVDGGGLTTPGGTLLIHAPVDELRLDTAAVVLPPPRTPVRVYGVLHEVNHQRAQEGPSPASMLEASLQVPENLDPRFQALANELARDTVDDEGRARRVVAHLRETYEYSLDVGDIDRSDPLADFLFEKKEGWCEYFAGSAAILLRLQGIPTRYLRGFNVIGSQKKGDHYVVREWDRHAWIEAYIDGKGWLEYDPTPAAEYENLHAGLNDNIVTDALEWLRASVASLYVELLARYATSKRRVLRGHWSGTTPRHRVDPESTSSLCAHPAGKPELGKEGHTFRARAARSRARRRARSPRMRPSDESSAPRALVEPAVRHRAANPS